MCVCISLLLTKRCIYLGLLTTMIGSIFLLGKKFQVDDYLRAFVFVAGLVFFTLGDVDAHISFDPTGFIFLPLLNR